MKQTDTRADKSAERFFGALRDVFVGSPVEGQSGFINLMRIKSRYYTEGVFPKLQKDVEQALKPWGHDPNVGHSGSCTQSQSFRQELFDKLYDFFHRYFSPSGSIYFQHTPAHKNIYEKVYTDDRDVVLFWKTHMLYYVKTDRLFNSLEKHDSCASAGRRLDMWFRACYNAVEHLSGRARTDMNPRRRMARNY